MPLDKTIVDFFRRKGYPDEQARGIAAGIEAEAASDHTAVNDKSGALGLGQWLGSRKKALTKKYGPNPSKTQQLEFLHSELQGGDHGGAKVLAKKSAADVLRSYVVDFMRPAKGAETTGDIRRGRAALGEKGGDPSSSRGGSTYDRIQAARQERSTPSIQNVYDAYRAGKMDPRDAAQFEHDVNSGAILLPRGGTLKTKPAAPVLPAGVVKAYNSRQMSDEDRAAVDQDLRDGVFALPKGAKLQRPAARTAGELLGLGTRNILEGAGGLVDVVAAPLNDITNRLTGSNLSTTPFRSGASQLADAAGFARPETDTERLNSAIIEGGTQGLLTAGAGMAASGVQGATGTIGRALASAPVLDTASSALSGGASETARQSGAGPIGQIAAGLLAPAGAIAAGRGVAAAASRLGRRPVVEVIAETPRAALVDEAGNLTDDAIEIATQNGVTPQELRQVIEAEPAAPRAAPEAAPIEGQASRGVEEASPELARAFDEAIPEQPARATTIEEAPLPASAVERVTQANEFGVPLTRGQAMKSFDVQDAEQRLLASNGPEAEQLRQFRQTQGESINAAAQQLQEAFGPRATATERGQMVKDAIRNLRDQGRQGVTRLYNEAADLGGEELGLITDSIQRAVQDVQIDEKVGQTIKRSLDQELARYGLVGKSDPVNELGITKVKLDDGSSVSFRGEQEPLTAANAENFRQALNRLYQEDTTGSLGPVKAAIDDAVEEALESAATRGEEAGNVGQAYRAAREAHQQQKQTFANKDAVQQIIDWKKGTRNSEAVNPEAVFDKIFAGGKEGLTNLRKVKSILLSSRTPESLAAWRGIQAHGLAQIFEKAIQRNANPAGEVMEVVSGAKLRSSIASFGPEKLKVLLDPAEFNQLMKLRRVIEDATIPVAGTTNPSGSGNLLMRLLGNVDNTVQGAFAAAGAVLGGPVGAAGGAGVGRVVSGAVKDRRAARQAAETIEGVRNYSTDRARIDDAAPAPTSRASAASDRAKTSLKSFIETYNSPRIIAPVLAATASEEE